MKRFKLFDVFDDPEYVLDTAEAYASNQEELCRILNIQDDYYLSNQMTFTVNEDDYELIKKLYNRLYDK